MFVSYLHSSKVRKNVDGILQDRQERERKVKKGSWVQIEWTLLEPRERPSHLPAETRAVPLRMRAKGCLEKDAALGDTASVRTVCGRTLTGVVTAENPPYTHSFGPQIPEFIGLGDFLRSLWRRDDE